MFECKFQADENFEGCVAQLARVERTDFLQPMHIGEVAELTAEITFTSPHSLEVKVLVWAENIITGDPLTLTLLVANLAIRKRCEQS